MAEPRLPDPALLVVAAFSCHRAALDWAGDRLQEAYGPLALLSADYDFVQTRYYEPTMGAGLRKRFLVFRNLVAPECLPAVKLHSNSLEQQLAESGHFAEARPLNLDPGLLCLGKFLLATTKDQAHRIYLGSGIHAEVTLRFEAGQFEPWPWTYADYRLAEVRAFLRQARDFYRARLQDQDRD